ncbi:MAG: hypothetical protein WC083_06115 [Candidatus Methanomethylophilaceae archaeon]
MKIDGGRVVAGPLVAAQKLVSILLSNKGADPINPERGTNLVRLATTGHLRSEELAELLILDSVADAISQMMAMRSDESVDDEEVATVDVGYIGIQADEVSVVLQMTTLAGANVKFTLPIKLG